MNSESLFLRTTRFGIIYSDFKCKVRVTGKFQVNFLHPGLVIFQNSVAQTVIFRKLHIFHYC